MWFDDNRPGSVPGRLFVAAVLLGVLVSPPPEPARAQEPDALPRGHDVTQRWGIGAGSGDAHATLRYLWSPRYGFEAGLGFAFWGSADVDSRILLEGAFLYSLAPGERVNFFLRPGVRFANEHADRGSTSTVGLSGALEFEFFLSGSFSLGARAGLFVDAVSPPAPASNRTSWGLDSGLVTEAGFHFYLPRPE